MMSLTNFFSKPVLSLLLASMPTIAADLGTFGEIWDIRERDFLGVIEERLTDHLKDGTFEQLQQEWRERVTANALRPPPVDGIVRGKATRVRQFDPAFVVNKDIADHQGTVFARKGQRVSPFDVLPAFPTTLYFIDGDDKDQLSWLRAQVSAKGMFKIILVNGNIRDTAQALNSRVYFDQGGYLVSKFGLRQVPAVIEQEPGKPLLRITEVGLP